MRLVLTFCGWLLGGLMALAHAGDLGTALQSGQHVLLMRHALAPGVGDPPGYVLSRCDTQRNLDETGRRQATRAGQWLRAQGVRNAVVLSSPWCRCRETAERLGFGAVRTEASLASFFDQPEREAAHNQQLQQLIARELATRGAAHTPLILVTHHVNIRAFMGRDIGSGDMVLARVDPQGRMLEYRLIASP